MSYSYEVERRSTPMMVGAVVGTMCIAGVVGFLASSSATSLHTASPVATRVAGQTVVPATMPVARTPVALNAAPYGVEAEVEEVAQPVEYVYETPAQTHSWTTVLAGLLAVPLAALGFNALTKKGNKKAESQGLLVNIDDLVTVGKQTAVAGAAAAALAGPAAAYPIFAQQGYANPREATGRLVCANCHLAQKQTEIELPQAVLPDQVFEAVTKVPTVGADVSKTVDANSFLAPVSNSLVTAPRAAETFNDLNGTIAYKNGTPVKFMQKDGIPIAQTLVDVDTEPIAPGVFKATIKVPYDQSLQQVSAKGKPADLNVGAVVVLPEGFTIAPADRIPEKMQEEMNGLQFIQYSEEKPNILVVGPVPGKMYSEMTLPLLSPDPATNKNVHYGTLPVYVGGNRGRGQVYPSGEKSNNNAYNVEHAGVVSDISYNEKKRFYTVEITQADGTKVSEQLPPGGELSVAKGDEVAVAQTITTNPNVGGFGQAESQIVLQEPVRVQALLLFGGVVLSLQTFLVIKKKQYEQVQLSEMNF